MPWQVIQVVIGSPYPRLMPPERESRVWFAAAGFASSDTLDQFQQISSGSYLRHHPPIHTLYLATLSLGGTHPELVTLLQALALGALLAYAAHRLSQAGVPSWLAIGAASLLGLSPAVAPTILALWKDVPFTLFFLWAWIELLAFATDRTGPDQVWTWGRLGIALAGMSVFRGNGPITVILVLAVLTSTFRHRIAQVAITAGGVGAAFLLVTGPLYSVLGTDGSSQEPAELLLPAVAASYIAHPERFSTEDIRLLEEVAPLGVWVKAYDCHDGTGLLLPGVGGTNHPQGSGERLRRPGVLIQLPLSPASTG
jgi:hypothetical protein